MTLKVITWNEASQRHLATAIAFDEGFSIPAGTIRRWAHEHRIDAIAKAPGGAHLYSIPKVSEVAAKMKHTPNRRGTCK